MLKQWITITAGVLGLLLCPALGSAQMMGINSPNVSGFSAGTNYYPFRTNGYGPGYIGLDANTSRTYYTTPQVSNYYPSLAAASPASIDVRVPAGAELWFDGNKTTQTGTARNFVSPPLLQGGDYTYNVRARWTAGDKIVERTQQVHVAAGRSTTVDFVVGDGAERK